MCGLRLAVCLLSLGVVRGLGWIVLDWILGRGVFVMEVLSLVCEGFVGGWLGGDGMGGWDGVLRAWLRGTLKSVIG